jgi:hypothetical protein
MNVWQMVLGGKVKDGLLGVTSMRTADGGGTFRPFDPKNAPPPLSADAFMEPMSVAEPPQEV